MIWLSRVSVPITIAVFAAMIVMSVIGSALHSRGIIRDGALAQRVSAVIFFTLFGIFALAVVPAMIHLFVAGQGKIGNADVGMVRFLRLHCDGVTYGFWGFCLLGLLIALPTICRINCRTNNAASTDSPAQTERPH